MRRNNLVRVLAGLACLAIAASCATSAKLLHNHMLGLADKDEIVIVVYGDELSSGDYFFEVTNSYASMLKPRLIELWDKRVSMINSSEKEESYRTASYRLEEDILAFRPDIVLVMLGRIDAFTSNLTVAAYQRYVEKFLGQLKHDGRFVVVLTTPGLRDFVDAPDEDLYDFEDFIRATRTAAGFHHFPIIDIASHMKRVMLTDRERYMGFFNDNSNLSEDGKMFIANIIYEAFANAMEMP